MQEEVAFFCLRNGGNGKFHFNLAAKTILRVIMKSLQSTKFCAIFETVNYPVTPNIEETENGNLF